MNSKKITLGILIGLLLVLTVGAYWYFMSNNTKPLFQQLNTEQLSEIRQFLDTQGISYDLTQEGELLVERSMIPSLRMEIAEKGVIQSERVGFEIFTEADYGMTEFAQKVNYQRALQGELEKSILSIDGIQHTRVHLILPKKGTLFSKQRTASSSVLVHMQEGKDLLPSTIMGIQRLVSGAVEELELEEVTVVDKFGSILSAHVDGLSVAADSQELSMKDELDGLLQQWYNLSDYSISLSMVRDIDRRSTKRETIAPDGKKFVVSQTDSSNKNGDAKAANDSKQKQIQYTYSKETETIEYGRSNIKYIRCAIVFGIALTDEEIEKVKRLVSAALGLDSARGDTLEVLSSRAKPSTDSSSALSGKATALDAVSSTHVEDSRKELDTKSTSIDEPSKSDNRGSTSQPSDSLTVIELIKRNDALKVMAIIVGAIFLALFAFIIFLLVANNRVRRQRQENIELLSEWVKG